MIKKNICKIILILTIIIFTILVIPKTFQNDTFFNISIGKYIINNGIDMMDHFSIHEGLEYTYSHWAFDILMFKIYEIANFEGIYIFTVFMGVVISCSLFYALNKISKNILISFLATIISIYISNFFITPRSQIVSILMFIWEIYFLENYYKTGKFKNLIYLFFISIIIANFHSAVWPMYFILFLPYLAENILSFIEKKEYNGKIILERNKNFKKITIFMVIMLFSGLLTPTKITTYIYIIKSMSGSSINCISEMMPIVFENDIEILYFIFAYILILLIPKTKIILRDGFLFVGLIFMTIMSVRYGCFLIIVGMVPFVRALKCIKDEYKINLNKKVFVPLIIIIACIFAIKEFNNNKNKKIIDESIYPFKACEYIVNNLDYKNIRIYNSYNFGSVLMMHEIPVFIDSRLDVYCKEFTEKDIFGDWRKSARCYEYYEEIFDKYEVTHVLLLKTENLEVYISKDKNYKNIYEDESFVLYERNRGR